MLQDSIIMLDGSDIDNLAIVGGTAFPVTTNTGELFFRTDENKLYIRNAADDGWVDLAGAGGGGGSTDTATRKLVAVDSTDAYVEEHMIRAFNQYAGWTTVKTIAWTGTGGTTYTSGIVESYITGLTNSVGTGSRVQRYDFDIAGGVFTAGSMFNESSNAAAPSMRVAVSGTNFLIQVQGSGGVQTMSGSIYLKIIMPAAPGGTSVTIS